MAILSSGAREIEAKLVYYGTAVGGKTTNLRVLHWLAEPQQRQKLISLNTAGDRTLFFDLLPFDLGAVLDWRIRLKLYSIPGQPEYSETRRVVLRASDAIVFVADSARIRQSENRGSVDFLKTNLAQNALDAERIPLVFQWNKRDLVDPIPIEELERELNWRRAPAFPATAIRGEGVLETFEAAVLQLLEVVLARFGARSHGTSERDDLRAILGAKMGPLRDRLAGWQEGRAASAAPSPRHLVVKDLPPAPLVQVAAPAAPPAMASATRVGGTGSRPPAAADPVLETGAGLEDALGREIRLLNQLLDREAETQALDAKSAGFERLDPESLRSALAEAAAAPDATGSARPLLRLAREISGAEGGSVLLLVPGEGALAEALLDGLDAEPLNRLQPGDRMPLSRILAASGGALWGEELQRLAGGHGSGLKVGSGPLAALPIVAGSRRVGLLVLHDSRTQALDASQCALLLLLAATFGYVFALCGHERRSAAPARGPDRVAEPTPALTASGV